MQLKDAADSLYFVHHGLSAVKYDLTQASERAVCLCVCLADSRAGPAGHHCMISRLPSTS